MLTALGRALKSLGFTVIRSVSDTRAPMIRERAQSGNPCKNRKSTVMSIPDFDQMINKGVVIG